MTDNHKPGILITGATGFLGGRLIRHLSDTYKIFAIGRRSPYSARAPQGPDIHWFMVDIGHFDLLRDVFYWIKKMGGADTVLHLAGYYDFTGDDHPEYRRTNVIGTHNLLELCTTLEIKKFIFTSSVAACPFPEPGGAVTEETPPTAPPPYSVSKRAGEEMLVKFRDQVPSCILRLAAIFSNWCEYEPLNNFLDTWFSGAWNSRILGGRGQWAIPYLHVRDLIQFYLRVVDMCHTLEPLEVLQASPNGCTTHHELFTEATRVYFGSPRRPFYMPKSVARLGINMRERVGRMTGKMPFERAWMGEYIDLKLNIDASRTHRRLNWQPTPELDILRCIPTMIERMRTQPEEWHIRKEMAKKGIRTKPFELDARFYGDSQ